MRLKTITLKNVKNFVGVHTFNLKKINLIEGKNGTGKSTLIVDSILFALYGYYSHKLSSLPSKGVSKSCSVSLTIDHKEQEFVIVREQPLKLTITIDGVLQPFATNTLAQEFLSTIFKDVDYFKKFFMLDVIAGINILEQGKTALRKTLISYQEEYFNKIRTNLLEKKKQRDIFNKDNLKLQPLYPSIGRLEVLKKGIVELSQKLTNISVEASKANGELNKIFTLQGQEMSKIELYTKKYSELTKYDKCPTCSQIVPDTLKEKVKKETESVCNTSTQLMKELNEKINAYKESINLLRKQMEDLTIRKDKTQANIFKLNERLKQKDYIWTTKDCEIIKKSIEELDKFQSYYLTENIKSLEPIINNIIVTIGFSIKFILDKNGNLDIELIKGNESFVYKDLSNGQKLILSIAFQLALLLNSGEEGFIITDEGMSSLDEENLNMVFDLFSGLSFQVLSILHRFNNPPSYVNIIKLVKK